ncbi:MAG: hypothetical protein ACE5K7_04215, partial [Phycisphaerae bacterium]
MTIRRIGLLALMSGVVLGLGRAGRAGQAVCRCIADNSIASHPSEVRQNRGGRSPIKIKGRENQLIMKFDLSGVPARASITSATLRVRLAGPQFCLRQVGLSSISTDWVEGTGAADGQHDYACHLWPGPRSATWAGPGSTFLDVIFGNGGSIGTYTFARREGDGWWAIDVDPRIVAAMRADSFGLAVQDETGIWGPWRANIMVSSREEPDFAPTLTVVWGPADTVAPSAVTNLSVRTEGLDDGQVVLEFVSGGDDGTEGTALGYDIRYLAGARIGPDNWSDAKVVPRYQVPRPGRAGQPVRGWITGLKPGATYGFAVVAYDESGNRSPIAACRPVRLPGPTPPPRLHRLEKLELPRGGPVVVDGKMGLWATDELTRVDPVSGCVLDGPGYVDRQGRAGSHVWDGRNHVVRLTALRGEVVAFNLVIEDLTGQGLSDIRVRP